MLKVHEEGSQVPECRMKVAAQRFLTVIVTIWSIMFQGIWLITDVFEPIVKVASPQKLPCFLFCCLQVFILYSYSLKINEFMSVCI